MASHEVFMALQVQTQFINQGYFNHGNCHLLTFY